MTNAGSAPREITTEGRATVGRATTVHKAKITAWVQGDKVIGREVRVSCGAARVRGMRNAETVQKFTTPVDCAKCLAH